jgi:putative transposase
LWSERRTVRKTATVSLRGNTYHLDPSLAGRRVELVFDPFDLASIEVRWQGRPAGRAIPHVIGRHAHPKARPEQPAPPAPATGIEYIGLIGAAHDTRLASGAISFAGLADTDQRVPCQNSAQGPDLLLYARRSCSSVLPTC